MQIHSLILRGFVACTFLLPTSQAAVLGSNAASSQNSSASSNPAQCFTVKALTSPAAPITTTWETRTTSCTISTTTTETIIYTPNPSISTLTNTFTFTFTAAPHIKTSTISTTVTHIRNFTTFSTTVNTKTRTLGYVFTSTVPASSPFVPVQSSIPGATYVPDGKYARRDKSTGPLYVNTTTSNQDLRVSSTNVTQLMNSFPKLVRCYEYSSDCTTKIITKTHTTTTTKPTIMTSTTKTLTTTYVPAATFNTTQTMTTVTTATITAFKTQNTQVTTSAITSTATFYEACATNNFVDQINGYWIDSTSSYGPADDFTGAPAKSAYECCVFAITNPIALNWFYYGVDQWCAVPEDSTCQAPRIAFTNSGVWYDVRHHRTWDAVAGNAYCGQITQHGV